MCAKLWGILYYDDLRIFLNFEPITVANCYVLQLHNLLLTDVPEIHSSCASDSGSELGSEITEILSLSAEKKKRRVLIDVRVRTTLVSTPECLNSWNSCLDRSNSRLFNILDYKIGNELALYLLHSQPRSSG